MLYRNFDFVEVKVSEAKPYVFKTSAKIILLFEYNKRLTTFFKMEKQLLYFFFNSSWQASIAFSVICSASSIEQWSLPPEASACPPPLKN